MGRRRGGAVTARRSMTQSGRHFGAIERQHPHVDAGSGVGYSGNSLQSRRCNRPHSRRVVALAAEANRRGMTWDAGVAWIRRMGARPGWDEI